MEKSAEKSCCFKKKLHEMLHLYGYEDIQTPAFEFLEVFGKRHRNRIFQRTL